MTSQTVFPIKACIKLMTETVLSDRDVHRVVLNAVKPSIDKHIENHLADGTISFTEYRTAILKLFNSVSEESPAKVNDYTPTALRETEPHTISILKPPANQEMVCRKRGSDTVCIGVGAGNNITTVPPTQPSNYFATEDYNDIFSSGAKLSDVEALLGCNTLEENITQYDKLQTHIAERRRNMEADMERVSLVGQGNTNVYNDKYFEEKHADTNTAVAGETSTAVSAESEIELQNIPVINPLSKLKDPNEFLEECFRNAYRFIKKGYPNMDEKSDEFTNLVNKEADNIVKIYLS